MMSTGKKFQQIVMRCEPLRHDPGLSGDELLFLISVDVDEVRHNVRRVIPVDHFETAFDAIMYDMQGSLKNLIESYRTQEKEKEHMVKPCPGERA